MNAPKVNPEVQLPPATHTTPIEVPPGGFVKVEGDPRQYIAIPPQPNGHLATALAKAQGEMKNPAKTKTARIKSEKGSYEYRYADLAEILDSVRGPLSKHGLGHTQTMEMCDGQLMLVTTLHHTSGQTISSYYPLPTGAKPQEFGSALTYGRRYSLSAIAGIAADEDDDAEVANKIEDKPITPEQVEHLKILLSVREAGTEARLLTYMSKLLKHDIAKLEDIPGSQFAAAYSLVEKKAHKLPAEKKA